MRQSETNILGMLIGGNKISANKITLEKINLYYPSIKNNSKTTTYLLWDNGDIICFDDDSKIIL